MKKIVFTALVTLLPSFAFALSVDNEDLLKQTYKKALSSNDKEFAQIIKQSQRAWLKGRNESCKFFLDEHFNDTDLSNDCITIENEARIKLLNKINSINN